MARRAAGVDAARGEVLAEPLEIGAVVLDLLRFAQLEFVEVPGRPAVGDVHQQQPGAGQSGELLDVRRGPPVGGECSMATRMLVYMRSSAEERLPQQPDVQDGDQEGHRPGERDHPPRRDQIRPSCGDRR